MRQVALSQLAQWSDGALIQGTPAATCSAVSTDSRKVAGGELFVALKGDRFDAHHFLDQVVAEAAALLVSELNAATEEFGGGIIHVRDTLKALQGIARGHRLASPGLRVVGVTGSNGKTSTKDFLGSVLSRIGPVNKTQGNLNNHIGLPLTILSGCETDRYGVWEMGMNHAGEIEVLAEIANPNAAVITHIGTAHIEHLKTRDAIAEEKSEIAMRLDDSGYCVMPLEDDYFDYVRNRVSCPLVSVGFAAGDVQATDLRVNEDGRSEFTLVVPRLDASVPVTLGVRGKHMVQNALLAAAVGIEEGLEISEISTALANTEMTGGRLQEQQVGEFSFLNDSYNANPDSMQAALRTLKEASVEGRRIAVLGFMGELGEIEEEEHLKLGERVVELGVDVLVTVGEKAKKIHEGAGALEEKVHFLTHDEAASFLKAELNSGDLTLVKGSRGATMEKVIEGLI